MRNFILLMLSSLFLLACDRSPTVETITGYAQGTTYSVKYWREKKVDNAAIKQAVDQELARIDSVMSNYRDDSDIEAFNQNKVANIPIMLNDEILNVLKISAEVNQKSLGCYDPTIGPLFSIWGFKKDNLHIPDDAEIAKALEAVGFTSKLKFVDNTVTKLNPETTIGLSAIGQGYAVAKISELLESQGIHNYLTEIGGEMLVAGTKPDGEQWHVGVERPIPNSQKVSEVISITGAQPTAIMTSGTYRHYFDANGKRYSHILDPRTGKPVEHDSVATTVLLPDATYADAWSTALLCLGSEAGLQVANDNAIPVVFYDIKDNQIIRQESNSVAQQQGNWTIQQPAK